MTKECPVTSADVEQVIPPDPRQFALIKVVWFLSDCRYRAGSRSIPALCASTFGRTGVEIMRLLVAGVLVFALFLLA